MRLHFMEPQDALDTTGRLIFEASQLRRFGKIGGGEDVLSRLRNDPSIVIHPSWTDYWLNQSGVRVSVAYRDGDGFAFYGVRLKLVADDIIGKPNAYKRHWSIWRLRSHDGVTLDELEQVFEGPTETHFPGGIWLTGYWMCRNSDAGSLHFYIYAHVPEDKSHYGLYGFRSTDGKHFELMRPESVVPTNHDNCCVMWDPDGRRFVMQSLTTHPYAEKPIIDNAGARRRVLSVWEGRTDGDFSRHLNDMSPDSDDAGDVEFYRVTTFRYGSRYVALANLYAASPLRPKVHGPHLRCEWWISDDCAHWRRHWRALDAQGDAPYTVEVEPIHVGDRMIWWINDEIWGLDSHRIAGVTAQSNGAFTTHGFVHNGQPLHLNAAVRERPRFFDQDYVKAEIVDEWGVTLPGYEADKCLIRNTDAVSIPLRWEGRDATELKTRRVALRFFFRGARLFSLDDEAAH